MKSIPTLFFATGAVFVLIGMGWGIHMSASGNFQLAPAHAHLNLIGFVLMSIYGAYYALTPKAAETTLAKIHYGLGALTVVIIVPGIVQAIHQTGETLAKIGSILAVLTMLVFLYTILRNGVGNGQSG